MCALVWPSPSCLFCRVYTSSYVKLSKRLQKQKDGLNAWEGSARKIINKSMLWMSYESSAHSYTCRYTSASMYVLPYQFSLTYVYGCRYGQ